MKIKIALTGIILDMYDNPLKRDEKGTPLTMKDVMMQSLLTPKEGKPGDEEKQDEKWEKFLLYRKIKKERPSVLLTTEEIVKIKKLIGKTKPELIMGQAWEILESGEQVKEITEKLK